MFHGMWFHSTIKFVAEEFGCDEAGNSEAGTDRPEVQVALRSMFELGHVEFVAAEEKVDVIGSGVVPTSENWIDSSGELLAGDVRIPLFGDALEPGHRSEWQSWKDSVCNDVPWQDLGFPTYTIYDFA